MKKSFLLLIMSCFCLISFAQGQTSVQDKLSHNLINLHLPPIDSLFELAYINSPNLKKADAEIEKYEEIYKSTRWYWSKRIYVIAAYQYGQLASLLSDSELAYVPSYANKTSTYWHFGISMNFPLSDIFTKHHDIKSAKAEVEYYQYTRETYFETLKIQISEKYADAYLAITLIPKLEETYQFSLANSYLIEKQFLKGVIDIDKFILNKQILATSYGNIQTQKANLLRAVTALEILTGTKIL
ncbi:MAG: TolC family protein [Bacteroidales bacterium]